MLRPAFVEGKCGELDFLDTGAWAYTRSIIDSRYVMNDLGNTCESSDGDVGWIVPIGSKL